MSDMDLSRAAAVIVRHGDQGLAALVTAASHLVTDEEPPQEVTVKDSVNGATYRLRVERGRLLASTNGQVFVDVLCLHPSVRHHDQVIGDAHYALICNECGAVIT